MEFFDWMASPEAWVALVALTAVEIVLGIDNIIFLSILVAKLPVEQQAKARKIGLGLAMGMRILLLLSLSWLLGFTQPLLTLLGQEISGRDLILVAGGLFLLAKATLEIHGSLEGEEGPPRGGRWSRLPPSSCRWCCWTSCSRSTRCSPPSAWPMTSR